MRHLFVFMGKSATGKDTLFAETLRRHPEIKQLVTYTTRPIREGEKDGDEYHFVDEVTLHRLQGEGKVIEVRHYDTARGVWYYFTAEDDEISASDADFAMITTLEGYVSIRDRFGEGKVTPIYIEAPDITRIERSLGREKKEDMPCVAEVCRRYLADEEDFSLEKLELAGISERILNVDKSDAIDKIDKLIARYR